MYVYINSKNNVTVLLYPVWGYIWLVTITCNSIYYLYLNIVLMTWWNVTFYKVAYGATCMQMFPDNAVKREMARMPTKCSYPFCTWTGIFRDYEVQYIAALVFLLQSHLDIYFLKKSKFIGCASMSHPLPIELSRHSLIKAWNCLNGRDRDLFWRACTNLSHVYIQV